MEYNVEHRVVLRSDSEFPSLYPWSISEVGASEGKVGRDQIPWPWTLSFEASEITLHDRVENETSFGPDGESQRPFIHRRIINATLQSPTADRASWNVTRYSFFGTDRSIDDIKLSIEELRTGEEVERCELWGCPSYTFEGADFRPETTEDYLGFCLYLRAETFARLATQISLSAATGLTFRVSGVQGFYSDWSPSIDTTRVKVLSMRDHQVEIPDGCEIDPPRLGRVSEFHLTLSSAHKLRVGSDSDESGSEVEAVEPAFQPAAPPVEAPSPAASQHNLVAGLHQLQTAAWVIVALLVFSLVRGFLR